jgi:uroporphyrinogen decarboxylase
MKERYDPLDIRRYPKYWGEELFSHYRSLGHPVKLTLVWGPGRGPKNGYTLGLERFLETLKDDPGFIHDIFGFWSEFTIELIRELFEKARVDMVWFSEDGLAYKNSTLVSPETYREFWTPHLKPVIDFIRSHGTDIVGFYTSGNITPLIPAFLETGFNLFGPLEVAADMDALKLRAQYGRQILLTGNIGRAALMRGPEAVAEEFSRKVPQLMAAGGYIPAVDDMILPDISFEAYRRYIELVKGFRVS